MADSDSIKLCECGCGKPVSIARQARSDRGQPAGQPVRFIRGHSYTSHRMSYTRTYGVWNGMLNRCRNPKTSMWRHYGGRGIKVCDRWLTFENFLADMGEKPVGKSLDRINNNGNYEPGNVKWATPVEQHNNTRTNRLLTALGKTQTVTQWAREIGVEKSVLFNRLGMGWTAEDAITRPIAHKRPPRAVKSVSSTVNATGSETAILKILP